MTTSSLTEQATAVGPLTGEVAIVTGGGRGLGEAIADELAGAGATVVLFDLRDDLATAVAERLKSEGHEADAVTLDITDERAAHEALERVAATHGAIDILINNAGTDITAPLEEIDAAQWDRVIDVNLRAPALLARLAFPHMRTAGGGQIVNITSTAAKRAWANASAYHASKWGLLGLSHALHVEGREHGIRVTAVVAGGMRTPFLLDRFPDLDPGILQDPRNVARAVLFALTQPEGTVIPEITVLPTHESSWP